MVKEFSDEVSTQKATMAQLLRRPEISWGSLEEIGKTSPLPGYLAKRVEIQIKYEGYIQREELALKRLQSMEDTHLPPRLWETELGGISSEGKEALCRVQPHSLGQASRVQGVSPADLSVLLVRLQELSGYRGAKV